MRNWLLRSPVLSLSLGLTTGFLTFFSANQAQAQVGLSPMVVQEEVSRGRAQSVLTVSNASDKPLRVRVYAEPFTYDRESGFALLEESDDNNLTPYLQFSPREFVVPARDEQRVRVVGLLPPSLEESEYRAVIFTEALPEGEAAQNGTTIKARVGATVYFHQSEASPELSASSAEWDAQNGKVQLLVSNAGTTTVLPSAEWTLIDASGETVASGDSGATTVIEGKDRLFQLSDNDAGMILAPGEYELTGNLSWRRKSEEHSLPFAFPLSVQP